MSLADDIRGSIATMSDVLADLKVPVTHTPWIGQDGFGKDVFGTPVVRKVLVDRTRKPMYTKSGKMILTVATLTILDPVPNTTANPGQVRVNPIDPRDLFVLDDGTTAPIVKSGGFEDAGRQSPFVNEVTLGNV